MWQKVTRYTAAIQSDTHSFAESRNFAYGIGIDFGIGEHLDLSCSDGSMFAAWMAILSTGSAEIDNASGIIRATR